jgi:hypothetical protein
MMRTIHNDKHLVLQSQTFWFVDGKNECTIIMRTNSVACLEDITSALWYTSIVPPMKICQLPHLYYPSIFRHKIRLEILAKTMLFCLDLGEWVKGLKTGFWTNMVLKVGCLGVHLAWILEWIQGFKLRSFAP